MLLHKDPLIEREFCVLLAQVVVLSFVEEELLDIKILPIILVIDLSFNQVLEQQRPLVTRIVLGSLWLIVDLRGRLNATNRRDGILLLCLLLVFLRFDLFLCLLLDLLFFLGLSDGSTVVLDFDVDIGFGCSILFFGLAFYVF